MEKKPSERIKELSKFTYKDINGIWIEEYDFQRGLLNYLDEEYEKQQVEDRNENERNGY